MFIELTIYHSAEFIRAERRILNCDRISQIREYKDYVIIDMDYNDHYIARMNIDTFRGILPEMRIIK